MIHQPDSLTPRPILPHMDHSAVRRITLGGTTVDLMPSGKAIDVISHRTSNGAGLPMAVVSANLDHVQHFGTGGRWAGSLETGNQVEWLTLLDGAPLRMQARRLTGHDWPRLAGSDLMEPLLARAAAASVRVGFIGGSAQTHLDLRDRLAVRYPDLIVAGCWSPERRTLSDAMASGQLADEISAAKVDLLVVGLGKPRQELWIAQHGARTGAKVLLAFGAVVDFLAGRVQRAPGFISRNGLEWAWRLAQEPQRLANRYLLEGPEAYLRLRRMSSIEPPTPTAAVIRTATEASPQSDLAAEETDTPTRRAGNAGGFVPPGGYADVAVIVVTYNNVDDVEPLLAGLRAEAATLSMRVVVADNSSADGTLALLQEQADVVSIPTGGNLGYAGGINAALPHAGPASSILVLNPDLRVQPGAVGALLARMRATRAGIVVPLLLDDDGTVYPSLRREPSAVRAFGDAAFGSRLSRRPGWLSEIDTHEESYHYAHRVEWATGAALLIDAGLSATIGPWDERFFLYSEETDYFRRARTLGASIWFEPDARMQHRRGGSGASPALTALMAVNKVRYAEKHFSRRTAATMRAAIAISELLRSYQAGHRPAAAAVIDRRRWPSLPSASTAPGTPTYL